MLETEQTSALITRIVLHTGIIDYKFENKSIHIKTKIENLLLLQQYLIENFGINITPSSRRLWTCSHGSY
ncbi:hypothetical protein JUNP479_0426 [Aeromonas jandaei]|nr:hypothetical protein JUNP479_0426 [Aeromonas jandaei]